MDESLENLRTRIEHLVYELENITQVLEKDIADPQKAVSLSQVKEIEASIMRFKKRGLAVPIELTELKIKLLSKHEDQNERVVLRQKLFEGIRKIIPKEPSRMPKRIIVGKSTTGQSTHRKPSNYEKPLGSKGYSNLEDYLIPVIKLMWDGVNYKEAFRQIARKLDVRYNTVISQCTRTLGLTTEQFVSRVKSKTIIDLIEAKYHDQYQLIKKELK